MPLPAITVSANSKHITAVRLIEIDPVTDILICWMYYSGGVLIVEQGFRLILVWGGVQDVYYIWGQALNESLALTDSHHWAVFICSTLSASLPLSPVLCLHLPLDWLARRVGFICGEIIYDLNGSSFLIPGCHCLSAISHNSQMKSNSANRYFADVDDTEGKPFSIKM